MLLFFSISIYPHLTLLIQILKMDYLTWTVWGWNTRVISDPKSGNYVVCALILVVSDKYRYWVGTKYHLFADCTWIKSSKSRSSVLGVRHGGNELSVQTTSSDYSQLSIEFTTGPASTTAIIYTYSDSRGSNTNGMLIIYLCFYVEKLLISLV
jgi:hypothetical protein